MMRCIRVTIGRAVTERTEPRLGESRQDLGRVAALTPPILRLQVSRFNIRYIMPPSASSSQDAIPSVHSIESSQSSSSSSTRPSIHLEPLPTWRTAKLLPYELREHCIIYFEESLCGSPGDSPI